MLPQKYFDSFEDFITYWQQRDWAITLQQLLVTFLWIGTTFDIFQLLGKVPVCKQLLKITERGLTIEESHIFNNNIDISS